MLTKWSCSEWEVLKMAVGSARPGRANSFHTRKDRQRDRQTAANVPAHSSFSCFRLHKKKEQTLWLNMNTGTFRNKSEKKRKRKRKFARWISICKPCKGVALLCFVTVATQFWQTPRAGDRLGPRERWFNAAAIGNQLSNSKAWHRIWIQDFLTGCHNMSICIVTWRGWALFLDKAQTPCRCHFKYELQEHTDTQKIYYLHHHKTSPSVLAELAAFLLSFLCGKKKQLN